MNLSNPILRRRAQHGVSSFETPSCGPPLRMRPIHPHGEERGRSPRVSNHSRRAHPSPSAQERAPQDEAANFFLAAAKDENRFHQDGLCPPRPIRLLGRPEPIEAIAEVPDGPPVRFRWRRVLHQVAHAEGPERIAMEWWHDPKGRALTRDYFRVES